MLAVILNCFTGVMASTLPGDVSDAYSLQRWRRLLISVLIAGLTPALAAAVEARGI